MTWGMLLPCRIKSGLVVGILFQMGVVATVYGQDEVINGADVYRNQGMVLGKFKSLVEGDSLILYAQITFANSVSDSIPLSTQVEFEDGSRETAVLELHQAIDNQEDRVFTFKWIYSLDQSISSFSLEVNTRPRIWTFVEGIAPFASHPQGGIHLVDSYKGLPLFDPFHGLKDSLRIESRASVDTVYAFYYGHSFDPARPPMSLRASQSSSELTIDSVLALPVGENINLPLSGLYLIQADTNGIEGAALYVGRKGYPKPRMLQELSEPLVYITTKEEFQEIKSDFSSKKAFDKFWLSTVGNPQKARGSIKKYYQFVESANRYFTSYKPGWKTDRGMIFTVMGPPIMVNKSKNLEIWGYLQGDSEVEFTFLKVGNIFSDNHYELQREEKLDRPWFRAIDRWRKGLTGF